MDSVAKAHELTKRRYAERNRLQFVARHWVDRPIPDIPVGRRFLEVFAPNVADFLDGKMDRKPMRPPGDLGAAIKRLNAKELTVAGMEPIIAGILREWKYRDDETPEEINLPVRIYSEVGRHLNRRLAVLDLPSPDDARYLAQKQTTKKGKARKRRAMLYLKPQWDDEECIRAGFWLFDAVMQSGLFAHDEDGFPCIAPEYQPRFAEIIDELTWASPVFLPFEEMPPPWTGFDIKLGGRLAATFVRKADKETRAHFEAAFERGGAFTDVHVAAVNKLREVPLRIDQQMVDLVEIFAADHISSAPHDIDYWLASADKNTERRGRRARRRRRLNALQVKADVAAARFFKGKTLHIVYSCDTRGRVYALSHLNFMREDHVRALFRFANGEPLGPEGLCWLEINCANAEGSKDKAPWHERVGWVRENETKIKDIAADPRGTFDLWRKAENPFQFVAACIELAAAWASPETFVTTLPIASDGSCNGLQHLAMITRDEKTAYETNLIGDKLVTVWDNKAQRSVQFAGTEPPRDIYRKIINRVWVDLEANATDERAGWWLAKLNDLEPRQVRKMLKRPAMAYAYSITERTMASEIEDYYKDIRPRDEELTWRLLLFLAGTVKRACQTELRKPTQALDFIRGVVGICNRRGEFVSWPSPTFPVSNRYQAKKPEEIYLGSKHLLTMARELIPGPKKRKSRNSAPANFVHSMDASHLACVVNAAMPTDQTNSMETPSPLLPPRIDVLPIHDCYACLAPRVPLLGRIIRVQLGTMYTAYGDALDNLAKANKVTPEDLRKAKVAVPEKGKIVYFDAPKEEYSYCLDAQSGEYSFA